MRAMMVDEYLSAEKMMGGRAADDVSDLNVGDPIQLRQRTARFQCISRGEWRGERKTTGEFVFVNFFLSKRRREEGGIC